MPAAEWITFAELSQRIPNKSERTLRRYVADKLISSRRTGGPRGPLEFNWSVVERELRCLETEGVNAFRAAGLAPLRESPEPSAVIGELAALRAEIAALRADVRGLCLPLNNRASGAPDPCPTPTKINPTKSASAT